MKKRIKEIETKDIYAGERSPYWDFVKAHARGTKSDSQIEIIEDVVANPDLLDSETNLFNRPLSETGERQLEAVREALPLLSEKQRRVLYLCGIKGLSQAIVAKKLGISEASLSVTLNRARQRIIKFYNENG